MFSAASRPLLMLTLVASALSIAGCGKRIVIEENSETAAGATGQSASAVKVNYWKTIAPFVTGAYAAQCLPASPPKLYPDTLTINADGRMTTTGFNEDLAQATSIVLGRGTDKGITENVMGAELGDFHLNMFVRSDGTKTSWIASKKDKSASCEQSADMANLKGKVWVTALAPTLTTLPRTISCIATGNLKQEQVDFRLTDGVATINQENFALKDANQETAIFSDGLSTLHYSATFADQRVLRLDYNGSGKLDKISGQGSNNQLYVCEIK